MKKNVAPIIIRGLEEIKNNPKFNSFSNFAYDFPTHLDTESILFIGINPSTTVDKKEGYSLDQRGNKFPYFKKMEEVSIYSKADWTHLDLLYFRETEQITIYDILNKENGVAYIWEQLQLTDKLIKEASPKVIVVCNALAATFLGKEQDKQKNTNVWLGYDFIFDNTLGTYTWNDIPVFFSGMLSGQRALDKGSFERLKWHIKQVLKHRNP